MGTWLSSIEAEYRRYKALAESAVHQLDEPQLHQTLGAGEGNCVATIFEHVAGNLESRFTDFLTSDGEKPWRNRDAEFEPRERSRAELLQRWERGWSALFDSLSTLSEQDLTRTVTIRGQPHSVPEALHRSLAHTSYHVGQVVLLARSLRGADWKFLSIPPGGSAAYNKNPDREKAPRYV